RLDLNFSNILLQNIYEQRAEFKESLTGLLGYLYAWLVKVVLPLGLIIGIERKNKALIFFNGLSLAYCFLISGNKSVYFSFMIIILFYFFGGKRHLTKLFFLNLTIIS